MPRAFMKTKIVQVFHQDSPGVRVFVRRGWLKRLIFSPHFSHIGERHLTPEEVREAEEKSLELAIIFHALYERFAPFYGYTTRPQTRVFDPHTPNGKTMLRTCFELITGGYRLNDESKVEVGKNAKALVSTLRLLPIRVSQSAEEPGWSDPIDMTLVDGYESNTLLVFFNDGQQVYVKIPENAFEITPTEMNRIANELAEYLNAQLFVVKESMRVVAVEYRWTEDAGALEHSSRLLVQPSIWEHVLADPEFHPTTLVSRTHPTATPAVPAAA